MPAWFTKSIHGLSRINQSLFDLPYTHKYMKTVSTKLDKQTFEKFQEMCNHEGQCMSESLRDSIKRDIEAYEEGLEIEKEPTKSTGNPPRPVLKVVRVSYDGKTWHDAS